MPQTPKPPPEPDAEPPTNDKDRGYYYDDAHGYETYDPDDDVEERGRPVRPGDADDVVARQNDATRADQMSVFRYFLPLPRPSEGPLVPEVGESVIR